MTRIYIALGSNLGDRLGNLRDAIENLAPEVQVTAQSNIYETEPWGFTEQPNFLNQVIEAETSLHPVELLEYLKQVEIRLGRKPSVRYGPRLIDLDLLFFNSLIYQTPDLTIPHPKLHERAFVLVPLADIASHMIHPIYKKSVRELLSQVKTNGVTFYKRDNEPNS